MKNSVCLFFAPAGMYVGQPQMPFTPQGFAPGLGGPVPPTTMMGGGAMMPGMALPNGGYMGMQQQGVMPANQGQNMYSMQQGQQQGQWNMSQVTDIYIVYHPTKTHSEWWYLIHFMVVMNSFYDLVDHNPTPVSLHINLL